LIIKDGFKEYPLPIFEADEITKIFK